MDLVTFTEVILHGKLHFLCSVTDGKNVYHNNAKVIKDHNSQFNQKFKSLVMDQEDNCKEIRVIFYHSDEKT